MADTTSKPPKDNWKISTRDSSTDGLYALSLMDTRNASLNPVDGTVASRIGTIREFAFKLNPKTHSITEPAAVNIVPTQNGGKYIEHQGQIFKDIAISGTTGLRPNKKDNSSGSLFGIKSPFQGDNVDFSTQIPADEKTGFDDLIDLRNLFRTYWDLKVDLDAAPYTIMVWQNGKEGEFYEVEPISFRTNRDASSPLTFTYDIQLKTINKLELSQIFKSKDSRDKRNSFASLITRVNQHVNKLSIQLAILDAYVDRTATIAQAVVTTVLSPINVILQGLTRIITSSQRFLAIPRNSIKTLINNVNDLASSVNGYNDEINAYKQFGVTTESAVYVRTLRRTCVQLCAIYNEDALFNTSVSTEINQKASAYTQNNRFSAGGSSPLNLNNLTSGNSAGQVTIFGNDDLRTIALRTLGDGAKWKVLAILNNLQAPYIAKDGDGISVLRPGDSILVPISSENAAMSVMPDRNARLRNANVFEKSLGRDLKLVYAINAGTQNLFDFSVSPSGDLARVEGIDNLQQAMFMRMATEQGQLPTHPSYGLQFPLGTKAKIRNLLQFHILGRASFLADRRIGSVADFRIRVDGNVLRMESSLIVKNSNQSLAFSADVRR
jgi:hypothetical protein